MSTRSDPTDGFSRLRKSAEEAIRRGAADLQTPSPREIEQLADESEVHRAELERQAEALRDARQELEASCDWKQAKEALRRRAEEVQRLLEAAPAAVWIADGPQCLTITGNRLANEYYEVGGGENVSATTVPGVRRFFTPDGRELAASELPMQVAAATNRDVRDVEVHVQTPSGRRIAMLGNAVPLRDENGLVRGCIGAFLDITERIRAEQALKKARDELEVRIRRRTAKLRRTIEQFRREIDDRKKAEQALRESEKKFRTLAEQSPNMIFVNLRGRVLYANAKCEELMGCARDEFYAPDFDFRCLIAPEYRQVIEAAYKTHTRGEEVEPIEYALITRDGRRIDAILTTKLTDYEGEKAILGIITDVTEHKRLDRAVRESEQRYRVIVDHAVDGILLADPASKKLTAGNQMICRMLGYTREEIEKLAVSDIHPQEDLPYVMEQVEKQLRGEITLAKDIPLKRKDGGVFYADVNSFPITLAGKKYLAGFFRDMTERRRLEAVVQQSELKYRALAESTSDIPYSTSAEGVITYVGPQAARYGLDRKEIIGREFWRFVLPKDRNRVIADFLKAFSTGEEFPTEFRIQGNDGRIHWFEERSRLQRAADGKIVGSAGLLRDITERKELEKALAETAARERGRFGRELHDGLGQELTGLGYLATLLHKQLHVSGDPRADMAKQLARGIQSAIDSARQIARGVAPVGPEPGGLVAALERLVASSHAYFGTPCCFRCRGPVEVEDATVAGELFRIAQEAVTNAARHAGAKHIEVELAREADAVSLVVRDDGVGLPNDLSQSAGMGLRIMRYRAGLIGADLDVRSSDGGGTEIACTVPREGMDNVP